MHPQVLSNVVVPAYSTHDEHGVLFIGRTKCGKSTLSKSGGFAVSQHEMFKAASADLKPLRVNCEQGRFLACGAWPEDKASNQIRNTSDQGAKRRHEIAGQPE